MPMAFFAEIRKNLKFIWNLKEPYIAIIIPRKDKARGLAFFKTYYKVSMIKIVWCWQKNRHIDQWNRTESPGMIYLKAVRE